MLRYSYHMGSAIWPHILPYIGDFGHEISRIRTDRCCSMQFQWLWGCPTCLGGSDFWQPYRDIDLYWELFNFNCNNFITFPKISVTYRCATHPQHMSWRQLIACFEGLAIRIKSAHQVIQNYSYPRSYSTLKGLGHIKK
jgi:hypothetical protein